MESRAKVAGHAVHPMMVTFPLGLFGTSMVFDAIAKVTKNPKFSQASYYMIPAGVISGLAAGVFGLLDWTKIPQGTRAKKIGAWHALGNTALVALFAGSYLLRRKSPAQPSAVALVLAAAGTGLSIVTGWLGGELVERLGVSVYPNANVNASSSLGQGKTQTKHKTKTRHKTRTKHKTRTPRKTKSAHQRRS